MINMFKSIFGKKTSIVPISSDELKRRVDQMSKEPHVCACDSGCSKNGNCCGSKH